jgi:hypothetical protein
LNARRESDGENGFTPAQRGGSEKPYVNAGSL